MCKQLVDFDLRNICVIFDLTLEDLIWQCDLVDLGCVINDLLGFLCTPIGQKPARGFWDKPGEKT